MARTKEISYFVGRKVSDGNFGSLDFNVGEVTLLERGDDYNEEVEKLEKRVNRRANIIKKQIIDSAKRKKDG